MRTLVLLALVALVATAKLLPIQGHDNNNNGKALLQRFEDFKVTYKRRYKSADEEARALAAFGRNMQRAHELNMLHKGAAHFGVTKFSDVDLEAMPRGLRVPDATAKRSKLQRAVGAVPAKPNVSAIPSVFDWRKKGAVLPPGWGQGMCGGANPAFAAIYNIEGANFVTNGKLEALAPEEFVTCDTYDDGCQGGLMWQMYEWALHENGGKIYTNASMPYSEATANANPPSCNTAGGVVGATLSGFLQITPKDVAAMQQWIFGYGPITVAMDLTPLYQYKSGAISPTACPNPQLAHAATIVGWNDEANPPYWICKNSWGKNWGMEGYFYIQKGINACLIEEVPSTVFVQKTSK